MLYPKAWLRSLRNVPYGIGLSLVVLCFLLCAVLLMLGFPSSHNSSLFVLPVALAAWLFKRRGALLCIGGAVVVGFVSVMRTNPGLEPYSLITMLLVEALALTIEGFFIDAFRGALDQADTALQQAQQAQQAQQQITLAYEQQRQVGQLKDEILIMMNHELRTPLMGVAGYIDVLYKRHGYLDSVTQATFLERAAQGCEDLLALINNVLEMGEVDYSFQPPRQTNLVVAEVVQTVLKQFDSRRQQDHPLRVEVPERLVIWADLYYTCQVLRNLLSNAFKYTPTGTPIVIHAAPWWVNMQDVQVSHMIPWVCISVQDAGPGIPPAELPLLFGKFVRLQRDLSGTIRGTGLGLYLSKRFVEAMGGCIWVESVGKEGQGSCFRFTLPTSRPIHQLSPDTS